MLGSSTRAIDIQAPVEAVFPWLVQMGQGRAGFYSYDRLEKLLGLDVHSADHIVPEWQSLRSGDVIALAPTGSRPMKVTSCEEDRHLVLHTTDLRRGSPIMAGDFFREEIDGSWLFFVRPIDPRVRAWSCVGAPPGSHRPSPRWSIASCSSPSTS